MNSGLSALRGTTYPRGKFDAFFLFVCVFGVFLGEYCTIQRTTISLDCNIVVFNDHLFLPMQQLIIYTLVPSIDDKLLHGRMK